MKLLFTADIHIKLGQENVPKEWAKNRYMLLFAELGRLSKSVDLTVIGGDVFDKLPDMEELELYYELIEQISSRCVIYAGNHEAVKKTTTFLSFLKRVTKSLNPKVEIIDDYYSIDNIDFIPYNKLKSYNPTDIDLHGNILCTHVRGEIPPHVKPEVPLELFDRWDVVLAGDLHSYENSQRNILYPGSPVTTSFHRTRVSTGVLILDTNSLVHEFLPLELPQLIKKTVKAGEPVTPTDYDHTVYEVEGDMAVLANVETSELISKKITKRNMDVSLILDADMTMGDELREYLLYIMQLPEDTIPEIMEEYSEYTG